MSQYWFAVYTRPRCEKKVADSLTRKKLESFCPQNRIVKRSADRKKISFEPLFKSFVFVKASEEQLDLLRKVDGVVNVVYWLGQPARINETEIDSVRRFTADNENVQLERVQVNAGEMVRFVNGHNLERNEQTTLLSRTLKVVLPSLGFVMTAEAQPVEVEVFGRTALLRNPQPAVRYSFN